jgi:hypothetical protein
MGHTEGVVRVRESAPCCEQITGTRTPVAKERTPPRMQANWQIHGTRNMTKRVAAKTKTKRGTRGAVAAGMRRFASAIAPVPANAWPRASDLCCVQDSETLAGHGHASGASPGSGEMDEGSSSASSDEDGDEDEDEDEDEEDAGGREEMLAQMTFDRARASEHAYLGERASALGAVGSLFPEEQARCLPLSRSLSL